jgi:hypothetical protein
MQTKLTNMATSQRLAAAIAAAALALLVAWFAVVGGAHAADGAVAISPASQTVAPGGTVSVNVSATAPAANLGAWDLNVTYDPAVLSFTTCDSDISTSCTGSQGTIRIAGAATSQAGLTGTQNLGTLHFNVVGAAGTSSTLGITITDFADGPANSVTPATTNGSVTVAAPTPTPSPAPTASPTPVPSTLPQTGGNPSNGSSSAVTWLLVAAGLVVVSGGAWAVSRARREI